ncbi:hypothetical protein [Streptomyces sp. NPDC002889]|uniref:hypothetical protein n=1 Tax=Streptomyces sp. NPDC002889 TaxID=3364669 RepID=UPI0036C90E41
MRTDRSRLTDAVLSALFLTAGVAIAVWGIGFDEPQAESGTATGRLEKLAARAQCTPTIEVDEESQRLASCKTGDSTYVLTTFATVRGQREWISETILGGTYLVGDKWVAYGTADMVAALHERLGGRVESVAS